METHPYHAALFIKKHKRYIDLDSIDYYITYNGFNTIPGEIIKYIFIMVDKIAIYLTLNKTFNVIINDILIEKINMLGLNLSQYNVIHKSNCIYKYSLISILKQNKYYKLNTVTMIKINNEIHIITNTRIHKLNIIFYNNHIVMLQDLNSTNIFFTISNTALNIKTCCLRCHDLYMVKSENILFIVPNKITMEFNSNNIEYSGCRCVKNIKSNDIILYSKYIEQCPFITDVGHVPLNTILIKHVSSFYKFLTE